MNRKSENKIIIVTGETRIDNLISRFNTISQAKFYVEHLGADFSDYMSEHNIYNRSVEEAQTELGTLGRVQQINRSFLPNFIFGPDDIVVAIGRDGLVANTLKYLDNQPLIGVNPDPSRWDGVLLPFTLDDLDLIIPEVFAGNRQFKEVSMAKATLGDDQILYGVNDIFIGQKTHTSARYRLQYGDQMENQSSSGIIISTGLGSTGWFKSILAGATGITHTAFPDDPPPPKKKQHNSLQKKIADQQEIYQQTQVTEESDMTAIMNDINVTNQVMLNESEAVEIMQSEIAIEEPVDPRDDEKPFNFAWNSNYLYYSVREPFPSKTTTSNLIFGKVSEDRPLHILSQMPENGVIFSDGIVNDFLVFNSGMECVINVADKRGKLVI